MDATILRSPLKAAVSMYLCLFVYGLIGLGPQNLTLTLTVGLAAFAWLTLSTISRPQGLVCPACSGPTVIVVGMAAKNIIHCLDMFPSSAEHRVKR